jgi:hypothetical protein
MLFYFEHFSVRPRTRVFAILILILLYQNKNVYLVCPLSHKPSQTKHLRKQ